MHRAEENRDAILVEAEAARRQMFAGRAVDAYRVLDLPDLSIDRYLEYVIVNAREGLRPDEVDAWVEAAQVALTPRALVLKTLAKRPTESTSRVLFGEVPRSPIMIREEDAVFLCDLDDGVQTGLFLDHRETRLAIRPYAAGVEVLNLFAYTCAFSVHAALAGARRVTSVDVSKRALNRGRDNMTASGLDPDRHRWFADDVFAHLKKRGRGYGLIVLDPPVFGRAKRRHFSLTEDLDTLFDATLGQLAPDGLLVFSTHATQLTLQDLKTRFTERGAKILATTGVPADFEHSDHLKTLFVRL